MKTTLKITMLLLTASLAGVAFAGILGFTAAAALGAKIVLSAFAYAGALLVSSSEYDARRTLCLHAAPAATAHAAARRGDRAFRGVCAAA